jgi:predicted transcriptional regulator
MMEVIGMSIKEEVIKIIEELPESATIEDIMHQLYVRAKIQAGLKELDDGKGIPHDEAMERISKWLN